MAIPVVTSTLLVRGGRPIKVVRGGPEDWAAQAPGKRPDAAR